LYPLEIDGVSKNTQKEKLEAVLTLLDLSDKADKFPPALS
jgi:ABC-type methionine transport system ATPase subunit